MNQLAYWKNWPKSLSILFWMLLVFLAGSILYYIIAIFGGTNWVMNWEVQPKFEALPTLLTSYEHPLQPINTVVDTYLVKQTYWGSLLTIPLWATYLSLSLCLIGLCACLTAITTFTRFWFFVGMGLFIALVMLLQLEQLQVLGRFDNITSIAVYAVVLPLAYFLHAFRNTTSFTQRLGLFGLAIGVLSIAIGYLAQVPNPALYVMNYGLPGWLGLTAILLIIIAPEIIVAVLTLVTRNTQDFTGNNKNVQHFLVIVAIYLLNLILYYLEERGILVLNLFYIGPFWIFPISLIISIWTLRFRTGTLSSIVQIEPFGMFLFLGLSLIGSSTAAYAFATANSPLIETLEDAILYTHLGLGIAFLLYLIINFFGLIKQGQPVYKVMYRPAVMPLFTARLLGVIIGAAFYLLQGNYMLFTPLAGINIAIGDIYAEEKNLVLSQQYYRESSNYKLANQRANYALASLAIKEGRTIPATIFLKQMLEKQPLAYAYANLSNLYQENGLAFDALLTLRKGTRHYPNSGQLYNNLGLRHNQWQSADSALFFLEAAALDNETKTIAIANRMAVLAERRKALDPDSLVKAYQDAGPAIRINMLAYLKQAGYTNIDLRALPDSIWQSTSAYNPAWVLSYSLLTDKPDTALAGKVQQRALASGSSIYEEQWRLAAAVLLYRTNQVAKAFEQMQNLANRSVFNSIRYYQILGAWALEQHAARKAAEYFKAARDRGYTEAGIFEALALADAGLLNEAKQALLYLPDSSLNAQQKLSTQAALLALDQGIAAPDDLVPPAVKFRLGYHNYIGAERNSLLAELTDQPQVYTNALEFATHQAFTQENYADAALYISRMPQGNLKQELTLQLNKSEAAIKSSSKYQLQPLLAQAKANPFSEIDILLAVSLLNKEAKVDEAYELLRQSLILNEYSQPLLKAYALQSLYMGLDNYGEETLLELRDVMPEEEFNLYEEKFNIVQDSLNAVDTW